MSEKCVATSLMRYAIILLHAKTIISLHASEIREFLGVWSISRPKTGQKYFWLIFPKSTQKSHPRTMVSLQSATESGKSIFSPFRGSFDSWVDRLLN